VIVIGDLRDHHVSLLDLSRVMWEAEHPSGISVYVLFHATVFGAISLMLALTVLSTSVTIAMRIREFRLVLKLYAWYCQATKANAPETTTPKC
jgi:hypothetical protein